MCHNYTYNIYIIFLRYKAVTPENLWMAFEYVLKDTNFTLDENINVTQYMKTWTEQPGYPLVKVNRVNKTFVVTQVIYVQKMTVC